MYTASLQALVDELGRLPGIGPKTAQRLAFHILKIAPEDATRLADAIVAVKENTTLCPRCFNVAEGDLCTICNDPRRDVAVICVVEDPRDIGAVEKTQEFRGRYHVLHGSLNPIEGVGPDQLRVRELLARLEPEGVTEIILCTNPNLEGEATAKMCIRDRSTGPRLRIGGAEHEAPGPGGDKGTGAHGTRFERHHQRHLRQTPRGELPGRVTQGQELGMGCRILAQLPFVCLLYTSRCV